MTFQPRTICIRGESQRKAAKAAIDAMPVDWDVDFHPEEKIRTPDQNSLYWSGPLTAISKQAWIDGRQFCAETYHEQFKREFLPEEYERGITKKDYRKWAYLLSGERVLVGSTTDLTKRGFSIYLEQVYAFGASLGVDFHAQAREAA